MEKSAKNVGIKKPCPLDFQISCDKADECAKWLEKKECLVSRVYLDDWEKELVK